MGLSMILLACIYAVALFVISIHVVLNKRRRDASSSLPPLPPGPWGLPLIGNTFYFIGVLRHSAHRVLARLNQTYGPIASFRVGMSTSPFVVLSSPAAAREALAGNDLAVSARWVPDGARAMAHNEGSVLFLPSSNPLWKQHRVSISAHFSGRSIEMTRQIRDRHARRLAEAVRAAACRRSGGQPVAVGEAVFGALVNVVSNIIFSRDLVDVVELMSGQPQQQLLYYKGNMIAIFEALATPNISDIFPFLARLDPFGLRRRVSRNLAEFYKMFDENVVQSRLASGGGANHGDLLDLVLARHAKSQITRAEISKLFTELFVAGTDTSMNTVEWAMARLLRNPDKLAKLRAELAASVGSKEFVEESDLVGKLPYLHAVVKEILRLHPPLALLPREVAAEEGVSLGGFGMPKGTRMLVNLWAVGRDPTAWPEAEEFVPERFLGDDNKTPVVNFRDPNFTYIPFGAGRKVCPGMDMAARLVPLLLASLLHKVEWKLPDGMAPEDVDLREHGTAVLRPATPLRAIPVMSTV
ncbi:cytochrome P450 76M5-like [Miscanthus floridulus]|uniref:cytochrome P450 76M5-like n=1 Tax=Miscanthus floridulus TaxID=154761 RepID=UPI003459324D